MRGGIAFTKDCQLYSALQQRLCTTDVSLKFFDDATQAIESLRSSRLPFLFIDVRPEEINQQTRQLIQAISNRVIPKLNVVTVGESGFPTGVAADLFLMTQCHLSLTGERELTAVPVRLAATDEPLQQLISSNKVHSIPQCHILEGTGTSLTTREPAFFDVLEDLKRIAHRDVTILIVGETGTGKTTLARIIHERSSRAEHPFQHLACGALPGDLIESELFGHIKGAFTGADRNKIGRFQAAGKGTLLLDEIDVLDVKQQAKLLKVIETGEYEMVGSTEPLLSEARLITASNINLEQLTESSGFRSDLYYRLSVLEFRLLPLRERVIDIIPLAMQFVEECMQEHGVQIEIVEHGFVHAICNYRWPGNIRELKNHVRRAVLFSDDGRLKATDLSSKISQFQFDGLQDLEDGSSLATQVARNERELLLQALQANNNNRTKTAKALGISRVGLYKKLRRHGIGDIESDSIRRAS